MQFCEGETAVKLTFGETHVERNVVSLRMYCYHFRLQEPKDIVNVWHLRK